MYLTEYRAFINYLHQTEAINYLHNSYLILMKEWMKE